MRQSILAALLATVLLTWPAPIYAIDPPRPTPMEVGAVMISCLQPRYDRPLYIRGPFHTALISHHRDPDQPFALIERSEPTGAPRDTETWLLDTGDPMPLVMVWSGTLLGMSGEERAAADACFSEANQHLRTMQRP